MKLLFSLLVFGVFSVTSAQVSIGQKIANIKQEGSYVFDIDTLVLKAQWQVKIHTVENISYNKVEIFKGETFGIKQDTFYMLVAYDTAKKLKTARWLVKQGDALYMAKFSEERVDNDQIFYNSYFTVYGSDDMDICFPRVYCDSESGFMWTGSKHLMCDPDSPCKGSTTFLPFEK